jgi:hypothetical protein
MASIESKEVRLNVAPEVVFAYVKDLRNLIELLPKDKVSDWQGSETQCTFKVAGGYKIGLEHKSESAPNRLVLNSTEGSAMPFDLDIHFNAEGDGTSAGMTGNLDVNPFMRMMVEKPLKNLFDYIADRLEKRFN